MSRFRYAAVRPDGATVRGELSVPSADDVSRDLAHRGLFPVQILPVTVSDSRVSQRDVAMLLQSIAAMSEVGVPLDRALDASASLMGDTAGGLIRRIRDGIREGDSLATAMRRESRAFSPVTVGLIQAGERGTGLDLALREAARQCEREVETRDRIRAALTYPLLLLTVGTISTILIVCFVVPRFAALLQDVNADPPIAARILLSFSAAARDHGQALAGAVMIIGTIMAFLLRRNQRLWRKHLLSLPLLGPIRHGFASARLCRMLGSLLGCGVSALPALEIAADSAGDPLIAGRLAEARAAVAQGRPLATALQQSHALTATALQLIGIGEHAGRLASLLAKAADLEEGTADRRLKSLVAFLEPALILLFAAVVAFVAAGLLQAIYSIRPGGMS